MNRRLAIAAALAVPLAGLGASWAGTHVAAQRGTVWEVPIAGYDPRDLLRGHYVIYTYDWPGLEGRRANRALDEVLCIEGEAPRIARVSRPGAASDCASAVRAGSGWNDPAGGLASGRLYVSQDRAAELERRLADPALQGVVTIRVREDGHITPLDIGFRPRAPGPVSRQSVPPPVRIEAP
ncbi:GDYXXLXY domain-containing protein [Qipengyuania sp. MTN3-11]|uniref:GDYXXLXY domain-containing protein n=1 Tax=Qipengyuania sp. MTN3-11 TaxID=3056557 RepID=UPI0036F27592